ncbi:hypothetical protein KUTeg_022822 [Tegillarca granosa]|uniref:Uncharacterized protein n=1 Tax=Tegillarca granosa TaxID=220873 RepID=A0ABQ9E0I7_TEGGR|nr:hypothetical protein KUTeg_022822 [Tegillarca granosa]
MFEKACHFCYRMLNPDWHKKIIISPQSTSLRSKVKWKPCLICKKPIVFEFRDILAVVVCWFLFCIILNKFTTNRLIELITLIIHEEVVAFGICLYPVKAYFQATDPCGWSVYLQLFVPCKSLLSSNRFMCVVSLFTVVCTLLKLTVKQQIPVGGQSIYSCLCPVKFYQGSQTLLKLFI